jgi:hypothetical protein
MSATNPTNVNSNGKPLCDAKAGRGNLCRQPGKYVTSDGSLLCGIHAKEDPTALRNKEQNIIYAPLGPAIFIGPFVDTPRLALLPNAPPTASSTMEILGDMDQIGSLPKFTLDCPVLRLGANIFGAATTIQNAFAAEFTARSWMRPSCSQSFSPIQGGQSIPLCQGVPLHSKVG